MKKTIVCEKCKEGIMTVEVERPRYQPVGSNYIQVSSQRFDIDIDYPLPQFLPEGKGYEHDHYYHFKCWDKPIPDPIPRVIDVIK